MLPLVERLNYIYTFSSPYYHRPLKMSVSFRNDNEPNAYSTKLNALV